MSEEKTQSDENDCRYTVYKKSDLKQVKEKLKMREREMDTIIVDGKGTEKRVPCRAETVISRPSHVFGLTTFSEYLGKMQELSEFKIEESLWRDDVEIAIETPSLWFGVQAFGDSHIGSHGVDYQAFTEILAGWIQNDNLKTILLGDLGDFFIPKGRHSEGMLGEVVTPQTQLVALKKFFTEYQDEVLANTSDPSHTDWVYQTAGIDIYEYLTRELNIPLVNQGGSIKLNFGRGIVYDIMPFHKISKFKSEFNLTHAHKRALELHRDADVVLAGHTHKGDFEKAYRNGHEVSLVQMGTLLTKETGSAWAKKQGFLGKPRVYYPIVLFNTLEKRMQIIDYLPDAEVMLRLRK